MATTDLPFVIGSSAQGVALTDAMQKTLRSAAAGGSATAAYFSNQNQVAAFTTWVNAQGSAAWVAGLDDHGAPTYTASHAPHSGGPSTTMVLTTVPAQAVIDGSDEPQRFSYGGQSYNIAGTITGTLSYDQQQLWTVEVPLGLAEVVPVTTLAGYAWAGLVSPLLTGFWNGVMSAFVGGAEAASVEEAGAAAAVAAGDAVVDAVIVEGAAVSLSAGVGALAGLVVLVALPFILDVILHPSFQNLMIYNLTPYDMTWSLCFVNEGTMTMAPIAGEGDEDFDYEIPAMGNTAPPGVTPVMMAREASFSFASESIVRGLGYVMCLELTDPAAGGSAVGNVTGMIDVPWSGANSLAVAIDDGADGQTFYEQTSGRYEQTSQTATGTLGALDATATITFDYLTGEHSTPSGDAYSYNSLLIVQTTAA